MSPAEKNEFVELVKNINLHTTQMIERVNAQNPNKVAELQEFCEYVKRYKTKRKPWLSRFIRIPPSIRL